MKVINQWKETSIVGHKREERFLEPVYANDFNFHVLILAK